MQSTPRQTSGSIFEMAEALNKLPDPLFSFNICSSWGLRERQSLTGKQPPAFCPLDFCSGCNYEQTDTAPCATMNVDFQILWVPCSISLILLYQLRHEGLEKLWSHDTCTLHLDTEVLGPHRGHLVKTEKEKNVENMKEKSEMQLEWHSIFTLSRATGRVVMGTCVKNISLIFPSLHLPCTFLRSFFVFFIGKNAWMNDAYKFVWLCRSIVKRKTKHARVFQLEKWMSGMYMKWNHVCKNGGRGEGMEKVNRKTVLTISHTLKTRRDAIKLWGNRTETNKRYIFIWKIYFYTDC